MRDVDKIRWSIFYLLLRWLTVSDFDQKSYRGIVSLSSLSHK